MILLLAGVGYPVVARASPWIERRKML